MYVYKKTRQTNSQTRCHILFTVIICQPTDGESTSFAILIDVRLQPYIVNTSEVYPRKS